MGVLALPLQSLYPDNAYTAASYHTSQILLLSFAKKQA
ncbi:hypothetical protein DFQ45_103150 [Thiopseudomonas denitrificans]|uniref:Uncharacterized protein n=1 Tax=Thiopseudomonas denitrificans TaxID=1501432 RepID=A0A4R6U151_9GAMM|nr:hypothetical protein DFQ45_103150 [Thiopseudomonas denitrificans]